MLKYNTKKTNNAKTMHLKQENKFNFWHNFSLFKNIKFFKRPNNNNNIQKKPQIKVQIANLSPKRENPHIQERNKELLKKRFKFIVIVMFVISFIFIFVYFFAYKSKNFSVKSISVNKFFKKKQTIVKITNSKNYVKGLSYDIPEYPKSSFVFNKVLENPDKYELTENDTNSLYEFISAGQSIYFLDKKENFTKIIDFYKNELTKYDWEFISYYLPGDSSHFSGGYWINKKIQKGLRIYTIESDIWYETLSLQEAQEGLANRALALQQQKVEVITVSGEKVDEKTEWVLYQPSNWKSTISKIDFYGVYSVFFQNRQDSSIINLEPAERIYINIEKIDSSYLDSIAQKYIPKIIQQKNLPITMNNFTKQNSQINSQKALIYQANINSSNFKLDIKITFIVHKRQQMIYVLYSINPSDWEFYTYLQKNILELKEKKQ